MVDRVVGSLAKERGMEGARVLHGVKAMTTNENKCIQVLERESRTKGQATQDYHGGAFWPFSRPLVPTQEDVGLNEPKIVVNSVR